MNYERICLTAMIDIFARDLIALVMTRLTSPGNDYVFIIVDFFTVC